MSVTRNLNQQSNTHRPLFLAIYRMDRTRATLTTGKKSNSGDISNYHWTVGAKEAWMAVRPGALPGFGW